MSGLGPLRQEPGTWLLQHCELGRGNALDTPGLGQPGLASLAVGTQELRAADPPRLRVAADLRTGT